MQNIQILRKGTLEKYWKLWLLVQCPRIVTESDILSFYIYFCFLIISVAPPVTPTLPPKSPVVDQGIVFFIRSY